MCKNAHTSCTNRPASSFVTSNVSSAMVSDCLNKDAVSRDRRWTTNTSRGNRTVGVADLISRPTRTPIQYEHTARTAPDKQERHALSGTARSATMMVPPYDSTQTAHGVAADDSCSRVASLQRRPLTKTMSAAIFSSASIFSMTGSASRPACRMSKERRRSDQRIARRPCQRGDLVASLNRHIPGLSCDFNLCLL